LKNGHRGENGDQFAHGKAEPDFLGIGAQKAGTGWLFRQLGSHPDFWMPPVKELHYFNLLGRKKRKNPPRCHDDRDAWFVRNLTNLGAQSHIDVDNYARLFKAKGSLISGDITPAYSMLNDEIIQNIVDRFPELKVIFLARDPVDRAWSQLSMAMRVGHLKAFDPDNVDDVIRNLLNPEVLQRSYPSKIVARWRRYVHPDRFRVYFFDDLEENPAKVKCSILRFLGADPEKSKTGLSADCHRDAGRKRLQLSERVQSRLGQFFKKELKACADQLGGRAKLWPARYGFSLIWLLLDFVDDIDLCVVADWIT
jgi:hypothetical protein